MTFEHSSATHLLWLLVPMVVLLLLPLRKKHVEVGSMLLWQRVFENKPGKKLTRWLRVAATILLEGAILAALVLAGAMPSWYAAGDSGFTRRVLVVDRSARMQVKDGPQTIMDRAKAIAQGLVEPGTSRQYMLLSALAEPEVTTGWTSQPAVLSKAIDALAATDAPSDLRQALELAQSAADDQTEICLIADNTAGLEDAVAGPGKVLFYPCRHGAAKENLGIVDFDVARDRRRKDQFKVFLGIANNADRPVSDIPLEITLDDRRLAVEHLTVPPHGTIRKEFTFADAAAGRVKAMLRCKDALAADNTAYGTLEGLYAGHVYLWTARQDPFLMAAVGVHRDVELFEIDKSKVVDIGDLGRPGEIVVFQKAVPAVLPGNPHLIMISPSASNDLVSVQGRVKLRAEGPRLKQTSNLLTGVDFSSLVVGEAAHVAVPQWADVLLESSEGVPLILAGEHKGRKVLLVTFDLSGTTFVADRGYSIFFSNVLSWMLAPTRQAVVAAGRPLEWTSAEADSEDRPGFRVNENGTAPFSGTNLQSTEPATVRRTIVLPDGTETLLSGGAGLFTGTWKAGYYTVQARTLSTPFGVSLLDEGQTMLAQPVVPSWLKEGSLPAPGQHGNNAWYVLAWAAFTLLVGEWFLYHYRYIE